MNYRLIFNIIGKVVCVEAALMLPALLISAILGERASAIGFLLAVAIMLVLALPFALRRPRRMDLFAREGLVTVGLLWIIVSLLGALPYFFSGAVGGYMDCLFETVSGFSTTGGSILSDVESLPRGLQYWRCFTNWLGGMGVLVFVLIMSPLSAKDSGESMHLLRAESPGVKITKLVPRMKHSAAILYFLYIILSLFLFILLTCSGLGAFDSLMLTFSTAGTGGFSVQNASVGAYSPYVQWVVSIFMLLFSINFNIYFMLLVGGVKRALKNEEMRIFFAVVAASIVLIMIDLRGMYGSFFELLRVAFFQVTSIVSTTGFSTDDFDLWPQFSKTLLVLLMFIGGCGGSTAGGMKISRVAIACKSAYRTARKMIFPNAVELVYLEGEPLEEDTVNSVEGYMMIYFVILLLGTLLVSVDNFSLRTNLTAVLSCFSNVGPGLGSVGPTMNYAGYSVFAKLGLCVVMLLGRLEVYPILILFFPATWRK